MKQLHGFSGAWDPQLSKQRWIDSETFSYGIFPLIPKASGEGTKKGTVIVRVSGSTSCPEKVKAKAMEIVDLLDRGEYKGPKRVTVKCQEENEEKKPTQETINKHLGYN